MPAARSRADPRRHQRPLRFRFDQQQAAHPTISDRLLQLVFQPGKSAAGFVDHRQAVVKLGVLNLDVTVIGARCTAGDRPPIEQRRTQPRHREGRGDRTADVAAAHNDGIETARRGCHGRAYGVTPARLNRALAALRHSSSRDSSSRQSTFLPCINT